jgi:hypothetical protein
MVNYTMRNSIQFYFIFTHFHFAHFSMETTVKHEKWLICTTRRGEGEVFCCFCVIVDDIE